MEKKTLTFASFSGGLLGIISRHKASSHTLIVIEKLDLKQFYAYSL